MQRRKVMSRTQRRRELLQPGLRTRPEYGSEEIDVKTLWRAVTLEFIATTLFVFFACGSVVSTQRYGLATAASNILAAITQGFAIATFVYATSHTSGGHINPAVTLGLTVTGHIGVMRGIAYVIAQLLGGIVGAGILKAVLPHDIEGHLGTTMLGFGVSRFQGFLFEFILTFTLLFTIFGTALSKEASASGTHALSPLPIGFAVTIGVGVAFSFTGGSINPARTFGPAVVSNTWDDHYIYWLGPLGGALAAGLLQRFVITAKMTDDEESGAVPVALGAVAGGVGAPAHPPAAPVPARGDGEEGDRRSSTSSLESVEIVIPNTHAGDFTGHAAR